MSPRQYPAAPLILLATVSSAACAPLGHGPSPVPLPAYQTHEFGGQLNVPIMLPLSDGGSLLENGFGSTLWFRHALSTDLELIIETGSNIESLIMPYGNVALRRYLRGKEDPFSVALEYSLGLLSVDVGLPVALRLGELSVWLTSHPAIGYFYWGWAHIPIGVTARPLDSLEISATAGTFMFSQNFDFLRPITQFSFSYSW